MLLIEKCKKCGNWISADYHEESGLINVISNKITGKKKYYCAFFCPCCGNDWEETNPSNDQSKLCRASGGKVIASNIEKCLAIKYPKTSESSSITISEETKHMAKHAVFHVIKGLFGG